MKLTATFLAAVGLLALATTSSSAMPVSNLAQVAPDNVEQARVVCRRGYCYRTARRYYRPYRYGYYPSYAYRPIYRPYGYYRPYYGYGYRPWGHYGYGYGRPGFGFSFHF